MAQPREFIADIFSLQSINKAAAAAHAGVQPSAISHWLKGKPSISQEKLSALLGFLGVTQNGETFLFRDNEELLTPRIWRVEDCLVDAFSRCLETARNQYGEIGVALPADQRGTAILYARNGHWGVLQRCSPLMLMGHKASAARIGPGVIARILDGDTKALIDSCRVLALAGRVDSDALDVAQSMREPVDAAPAASSAEVGRLSELLVEWAQVSAQASSAGLSPGMAQLVLRRFSELPPALRTRFLEGCFLEGCFLERCTLEGCHATDAL